MRLDPEEQAERDKLLKYSSAQKGGSFNWAPKLRQYYIGQISEGKLKFAS